jgi:hypothetical protein
MKITRGEFSNVECKTQNIKGKERKWLHNHEPRTPNPEPQTQNKITQLKNK